MKVLFLKTDLSMMPNLILISDFPTLTNQIILRASEHNLLNKIFNSPQTPYK